MEYFTVYKTTNLINKKIYVGVHRTRNLNDGYLGSGNNLKRAILKYGRENFSKEILHYCDNAEEMYSIEKQIVNEDFIKRNDTYNLTNGGLGGNDYFRYLSEEDQMRINNIKSNNSKKFWSSMTEDENKKFREKCAIGCKNYWESLSEEKKKELAKASGEGYKKYLNSLSEEDYNKFLQESKDQLSKGSKKYFENRTKPSYNDDQGFIKLWKDKFDMVLPDLFI